MFVCIHGVEPEFITLYKMYCFLWKKATCISASQRGSEHTITQPALIKQEQLLMKLLSFPDSFSASQRIGLRSSLMSASVRYRHTDIHPDRQTFIYINANCSMSFWDTRTEIRVSCFDFLFGLGQRQAHYDKMPNNTGETDEAPSNTPCWLYLPENEA